MKGSGLFEERKRCQWIYTGSWNRVTWGEHRGLQRLGQCFPRLPCIRITWELPNANCRALPRSVCLCRSEVGPENVHFWQGPWCCFSCSKIAPWQPLGWLILVSQGQEFGFYSLCIGRPVRDQIRGDQIYICKRSLLYWGEEKRQGGSLGWEMRSLWPRSDSEGRRPQ